MRQSISAVVMVGLMLWAAHPSVMLGQPAVSANFRLTSQSLNGGLERSASASFIVSSCLAPEPEAGGTSLSASFRLHAGCGAAVAAVPTEPPTATPTLTPTSTATAMNTPTGTVPTPTNTMAVPVTPSHTATQPLGITPTPTLVVATATPPTTVTGTVPPTLSPTPGTATPPPTATATPIPIDCIGDCNGDGAVTINELIVGVNIALGFGSVEQCLAFDSNGDGVVAINELIAGVNNALFGCPP